MDGESATLRAITGIGEIDAAAWDRCAGPDNPFVSHAFLSALEDSGSATAKTGWLPQHLLLSDGRGRLIAAAPLYLKNHSYGEYVFDHGWADAFERAGGRYYPKLQCCVPFTPATGPRLLVAPDAPPGTREALIRGMVGYARQLNVSSLHVTFPTEAEWTSCGEAGLLQRIGMQFHWENRGYDSFDGFLEDLTSRKRKQIRRERREAIEDDIVITPLTGAAIQSRHWDAFHRFYLSTIDRKWGSAYLTRRFFDLLSDRMADRVLLVFCEQRGKPIGAALNLIGTDTLYGRNWGAAGEFKFLHFEACYYQAIDFAIARGIARVEAGAQGPHKIQRGYLPTETYSAHWIKNAGFARAVETFLVNEREEIRYRIAALDEHSPMKHTEIAIGD